MKKILKKEISIKRENIIIWKSFTKTDESSFIGRKPPDEIKVRAKFNESNVLIEEMFNIINIIIVYDEYNRKILIACFKLSELFKEVK